MIDRSHLADLRILAISLTVFAVGCGGAAGGTGAGGTGAGGAQGGNSGTAGAAGAGACPDTAPMPNSSCTAPANEGLARAHCSWGSDPRPDCRTTALCTDGQWQVTAPTAPYCGDEPLPAACPVSPPTAGNSCDDDTLHCWYPDGERCWCSSCMGGSEYPICQTLPSPEWACATPPAGCPNPLPQAGERCDDPDLYCGPNCEQPIQCRDGAWRYDQGMCPICASPDTAIATPSGEKPIAELHEGDLVYSVQDEAIVAVPLLRVASTPVFDHQVMRVLLDDGTTIELSPGHPTADGRLFSDLASGVALDQRHSVVSVALVPYRHDRTYDILPASSSKTYFAGGALVGSSLARVAGDH